MGLQVRNIEYLSMERKHIKTMNQLHAASGVHYTQVRKLWHGGDAETIGTIHLEDLNKIARTLGMKAIDLLEEVPDGDVK